MLRVAFDVGGVLSKYPKIFNHLLRILYSGTDCQIYILSDMHPKEKILDMLNRNGLAFIDPNNVISCDYNQYGEACKANVCKDLGIDILVDDFIGYVADVAAPVRLLLMPDTNKSYYADDWQTDGSEGDFGRRKKECVSVRN